MTLANGAKPKAGSQAHDVVAEVDRAQGWPSLTVEPQPVIARNPVGMSLSCVSNVGSASVRPYVCGGPSAPEIHAEQLGIKPEQRPRSTASPSQSLFKPSPPLNGTASNAELVLSLVVFWLRSKPGLHGDESSSVGVKQANRQCSGRGISGKRR